MRASILILALTLGLTGSPAPASAAAPEDSLLLPERLLVPYRASADPYSAGHRGADLAAAPGQAVLSPLAGHISFVGVVAGRPVTVIIAGARRLSLEPVSSALRVGEAVVVGQVLGRVGIGGHCSGRCVHVGLRVNGAYVDPLPSRPHLLP